MSGTGDGDIFAQQSLGKVLATTLMHCWVRGLTLVHFLALKLIHVVST